MAFETRLASVGELFSGSNLFEMPAFQRPFSWGEDMVAQLFDDIQSAFAAAGDRAGEPFFLGAMIVTRAGPLSPYYVIDGQQRLTTLSLILACLRDQVGSGAEAEQLQPYLRRPETAAAGIEAAPRLRLRAIEREAYEAWVVRVGGTKDLGRRADSDAAVLLKAAIERVRGELGRVDESYVTRLIGFIVNSCQLVLISTPSIETGFRLFQSVNTPGRPLDPLDVCRAEYIGPAAASTAEGAALARLWDQVEDEIGREAFEPYAAAVAARYAGGEAARGDLAAMVGAILRKPGQMMRFREGLAFFLDAFDALDRADLPFGPPDARLINGVAACLNAWDEIGWKPCALSWLARAPSAQDTLRLLRGLDALCFHMTVAGVTKSKREKRWRAVSRAIEADEALTAATSPLLLTPQERDKVLSLLRGAVQPTTRWLKPALRRLNAAMVEESAPPPLPAAVTLEHVLPQKPAANGPWQALFPDAEERRKLSARLGNFALLTPGANSRGGRKSFKEKKAIYLNFTGFQNFPLTVEIARHDEWSPAVITRRTEQLCELARRILMA